MTEADIHARFVRYYETVAELHQMGYELFRVCPYISPNGMCYRCWLTIKKNTWKGWAHSSTSSAGTTSTIYPRLHAAMGRQRHDPT